MGSCPTLAPRGEGAALLGPCWVYPQQGSRQLGGTDLPPPPLLLSRRALDQGPHSGGWKWPGLSFGILPISDLAEGRGCPGPWPHTLLQ